MNIKPEEMSSHDLVLCANELMKRTIEHLRSNTNNDYVYASIYAGVYSEEFEINHQVSIGHCDKAKCISGNLMVSATRCIARIREDQQCPPVKVTPMLTHQPSEDVVDGEFEDVPF